MRFLNKILLFLPVLVLGAEEPIFSSYQDIISFFDGLANILATIFWTAAVISAIYSGFLFLTAAGSEEKIGKARKMFLYTVIAIVIGLIAFGLPSLIKNILENVRG